MNRRRIVQSLTDGERRARMQVKLCDWFIERGWTCAYVKTDDDGKLDSISSGDKNWCQWGHYLGSGHYDWSGRTGLDWKFDCKECRGHLFFPNGRETQRWSSYEAIIIMPVGKEMHWNPIKNKYTWTWNGKPPQLWWHRARCNRARYERKIAQGHERVTAFTYSKYMIDGTQECLKIPRAFWVIAKADYDALLNLLNREVNRSERE